MYFEWKSYSFRRPPELDQQSQRYGVAIVGGGPVGLAMALALGRRGVQCVVLETRDQMSSGSRAIGVHRRTSQFFDRLGLGGPLGATARVRGRNTIYYGSKVVAETTYEHPPQEKWPQLVTLQQCWMEQILFDGIAQRPEADVRWRSSVTALSQSDESVSLMVDTPEGSYQLEADYVVAADGARGSVRRWCGLEFQTPVSAPVSDRRFVICDFQMKCDLPSGRRMWFNPPYRPGTTVIMHSQPFDTWRLDYAVEDGEDAEAEATPERAKERIACHLAMMGIDAPWTLVWTSVYRPLARSLTTYRHGRIFFVGDSAHQTPIFGGRGLNLGYADVDNLAWKLAYIIAGSGGESLLDSYSTERRAILMEALQDLAQSTIFMTRPTPGVSLMRDAALSLSVTEPFVAELFDAYRARRGETYASPFVTLDREPFGGPEPGSPIPDARLDILRNGNRERAFLREAMGDDFTLLYLTVDAVPDRVRSMLSQIERRNARCKAVFVAAQEAVTSDVDAVDVEGDVFRAFEANDGATYLIRPDLYVAARWRTAEVDEIDHAFRVAVGLA